MSRLIKHLLLALIVVSSFIAGLYYYAHNQVVQPINLNSDMLFRVDSGQSVIGVLNKLKTDGVINDNFALKSWVKLKPDLVNLKVGTYLLKPTMTGLDILNLLVSGKEVQFSISLVEGFRLQDWIKSLTNHPRLILEDDFYERLNNLSKNTVGDSLEGWLLPDTYYFVDKTSVFDVVLRAHSSMQKYLEEAWTNRSFELPYQSAYEGLIMSSIIEKETGVAQERPQIAGVFVNRLNLNMRLQTDPTVIYGMGDNFDGNIRRKDLRTPTPYNTYVIKGLPPTPIAMPSKLAIDAAFNPDTTKYLYFVSKGDGSHQFSETLEQHNAAVRTYQLKK